MGRCRVLQRDPVSNLKYFQTSYVPDRASLDTFRCFVKKIHNAAAPEHPASGRTVTLAGTPGDDSSVGGVDRPPGRPRRCVAATGTRTAWRAVTPSARGEWAGASRQSATPLRAGAPGATPSRSPRRAPRARARGCAKVRGASLLRRNPPSTLFARTRGEPRALSRDSRARTARRSRCDTTRVGRRIWSNGSRIVFVHHRSRRVDESIAACALERKGLTPQIRDHRERAFTHRTAVHASCHRSQSSGSNREVSRRSRTPRRRSARRTRRRRDATRRRRRRSISRCAKTRDSRWS